MATQAGGITEPTLADTLRFIWQARFFLLIGGIAGLVSCGLFLALAVPHYRATMIVAPTTRTGTTDLAGPVPDNASLATEYLMKSFNAGDSADFTLFEHVALETAVAARLIKDPIIRNGMAQDRAFTVGHRSTPVTPEDLAFYLQRHVTIEPVGGTALRRLVYDHPDRDFARELLQAVYSAGDTMIRADVRAKADKRIEWLKQMINRTDNPDDRRALTSLLGNQQQMRLMLLLDEPYAARMAEPPSGSVKPSWPRPVLSLCVFFVCGLMLGMVLYSVRRALAAP